MKNKGKIYAKSIYYLITSEWMVRYAIKGVGINTSKTTIREKTTSEKSKIQQRELVIGTEIVREKSDEKFSYVIFSTPQI